MVESVSTRGISGSVPSSVADFLGANRTTINGTVMGKDIGEILENQKKALSIPVQKTEESLQKVDQKAADLSKIQDKVQTLATQAAKLTGEGIGVLPDGAFATKSISLVSGNVNAIDAQVASNADVGQIQLLIKQLATKDTSAATLGVLDPNAALGWTGSFDVGTIDANVTINMVATMSLNDILDAVNAQSATLGIRAEKTVFPDETRLSFQATDFAKPIVVDTAHLVTPNTVQNNPAILPATSQQTVNSLSAVVQFRGINKDILYDSNTIPADTQVKGVSLTLLAADPNTPIILSVGNSMTSAVEAMSEFVTTYNDLVQTFQNKEVYKGGVESNLKRLSFDLAGQAGGLAGGTLSTLAGVGVTLLGYGTLKFDVPTLTNALDTKFDEVTKALGYSITSASSHFIPSTRPTTTSSVMLSGGVNITINKDAGDALTATMTLDGVVYNAQLGTVSGNMVMMKGPDNSPLAGFTILYNALDAFTLGQPGSATTHVSFTSGVVDQMLTRLNTMLKSSTGDFAVEAKKLVGDPTNKNVVGEKQSLEKKLAYQMDVAKEKYEKLVDQFKRVQMINAQFQQIQDSIRTMVKYTTAAAA